MAHNLYTITIVIQFTIVIMTTDRHAGAWMVKMVTGFGKIIPLLQRVLIVISALAVLRLIDAGGSMSMVLMDISIMLALAIAFGCLARWLCQPAVLGEILGGIILGPTVLGTIAPGTQSWIFPSTGASMQTLHAAAYLGLMAFLFTAGMEVGLTGIRHRSTTTVIASISGILLPFVLGFGMVVLLPQAWNYPTGDMMIFAAFMGTALSISALPVIARVLMDIGILNKDLGAMIVSAATIDDLIGWSLFAVILSTLNKGTSLWLNLGLMFGLFAVTAYIIYLDGRYGLNLESSLMGGIIDLLVVAMLAASILSESFGGHAIFGVFLAGVIFSHSLERRDLVLKRTYPLVMGVLAPIYFTSIGLKADFAANFDLAAVLIVFVVACFGKILGAGIGALASGVSARDSLALGLGLNARGAMEIVLASAALDQGLIDLQTFVALVVMALATTAISGFALPRLIGTRPLSQNAWEPVPIHELRGSYNYYES